MRTTVLLLFACTAVSCSSDSAGPFSYPQATVTHSTGSAVPMGSDANAQFVESRFQQLIPSPYVPKQSSWVTLINKIGFVAQASGLVDYASLKITMSFTSANALSDDFDKNLPKPCVVLDVKNVRFHWQARAWTWIELSPAMFLDDERNLVIDIRKIAKPLASGTVTMATSGNPGRTDLPACKYAVGKGASTSTRATHTMKGPLMMRFYVDGAPTLSIRSDRLTTGNKNVFASGGTIQLELNNKRLTPSNYRYLLLVGSKFHAPRAIPGVGTMLVSPLVEMMGKQAILGPTTLQFRIPKLAGLVGSKFVFQALVDTTHYYGLHPPTRTLSFTNGVDCIIRK